MIERPQNEHPPSAGIYPRSDSAINTPHLTVILVISGIFTLFHREMLLIIIVIVVGLLVGNGGFSTFA